MVDQVTGKGARRSVVEQNEHLGTWGRRIGFGAMGGESENSVNLFAGDAKFLYEFVNAHVLDVLKDGGNRCPGAFEYPCAAALAGNAFHSWALRPVERCHVSCLSFYHTLSARLRGGATQAEKVQLSP
jgi:hypothetical protein